MGSEKIKSVAVIGAGAAGAITTAALAAEDYFERVRVFERRETPGGTWIYDPDPGPGYDLHPGSLPPETDPPLEIPGDLPQVTPPNRQERFSRTPIYKSLTTNVPDIAMSFSDARFAYGPFAPHWVPRQYIENYFSVNKLDSLLELNTTVENLAQIPGDDNRWKLTLRKYDALRRVDIWWEEQFDAVILANGHYSVPYVPHVPGLEAFLDRFPGRVVHSKSYRDPVVYAGKKVIVVGNAASGKDISTELAPRVQPPLYLSIRSRSRWDGDEPPPGIEWKPVIAEYQADSGRVVFEDGTHLDGVDSVIYATGYQPSFPFWDAAANGRPLYDYARGRLVRSYWHTFFRDFPTLGVVGVPRTLTFRGFEYQAIALARVLAGRNAISLPPADEQARWEREREERQRRQGKKFHDIPWDEGQTGEYLGGLFRLAGLGTLTGQGRVPPVLGEDLIWALDHIRKYPEPGRGDGDGGDGDEGEKNGWVLVNRPRDDLLEFF